MITKIFTVLACVTAFVACAPSDLIRHGRHYQQYKDFYSLNAVVEKMPKNADTAYVRKILGEPIDMGFDYRYLLDSAGANGCVVGAVFHINDSGKIDQQWLGEICE